MFCKPARTATPKKGKPLQMLTLITEYMAREGWLSHGTGVLMMPNFIRDRLMTPFIASYIHSQANDVTTYGATHGRSKTPL